MTRVPTCAWFTGPDAPPALVLTEYGSLQQAHAALNRIGALADNVKTLARQVAPGWAFEALLPSHRRVSIRAPRPQKR